MGNTAALGAARGAAWAAAKKDFVLLVENEFKGK